VTRLPRLEYASERLDGTNHSPAVLERSLVHIEGVNRWLGGRRAAIRAVEPLLRPGVPFTALDVGCGGGDVARALYQVARRRSVPCTIIGLDRHPQIVAIARERSRQSGVGFVRAEGLSLPFPDDAFDVALMSLTLHHFDGPDRRAMLLELGRVARQRVIINDLERCRANYLGARLLAATVWRSNPLTRHDGPVSVLRSFTAAELTADLEAAGLLDVRVDRCFFYRLVASGSPRPASPAAATTL